MRRCLSVVAAVIFGAFGVAHARGHESSAREVTASVVAPCSRVGFLAPTEGQLVVPSSAPYASRALDLNGDGHLDLVMVGFSDVYVLLGADAGLFGPPVPYSLTGLSNWLNPAFAAGDFNGDGNIDIVVITRTSGNPSLGWGEVFLGNGLGGLTTGDTFESGELLLGASAGHFNGDALVDLVVIEDGVGDMPNALRVLFGDGTGHFAAGPATLTAGTSLNAIDVNNDSHTDVIALAPGVAIEVHLGDNAGGLTALPSQPVTGARNVQTADLNSDGYPDVAILMEDAGVGRISVLFGTGTGVFTAGPQVVLPRTPSGGMAAADFNGDGRLDLVVNTRDGKRAGSRSPFSRTSERSQLPPAFD